MASTKEYQLYWIKKRREDWINQNGPCVDCGSQKQLEVDHNDRTTKKLETHAIWSRRQEVRAKELAKCVVRCHDCHRAKSNREMKELYTNRPNTWQRKLKDGEVSLIKKLIRHGVSLNLIGKMFKYSPGNVSKIKHGKIFKHIEAW